jgi:hypothetical protein
LRHNNRSSPARHRDPENINVNGTRTNGPKSNYRNSEYNNFSTSRESHQSSSVDRNRNEYKNTNNNDQQRQQQQQHQPPIPNNKETRVNKSNGVAPRFKRNYEGKKDYK